MAHEETENIFSLRRAIRIIERAVGCDQIARAIRAYPRHDMIHNAHGHRTVRDIAHDIEHAPPGTQVQRYQHRK